MFPVTARYVRQACGFERPQQIEKSFSKSDKKATSDKTTALKMVGAAIIVSQFVPRVAADCPGYCYHSVAFDDMKVSLAGHACRPFGAAAVLTCTAAYRMAIEYDKRRCTEVGCGPFMNP